MKDTYILGISCFFHDSSVALMKNGEIVYAIEEEKLTRKKHDDSFPENAIHACLEFEGIEINDIKYVGFYEKPFIKFENFIKNYICTWPLGYYGFVKGVKQWLQYKLNFASILKKTTGYKGEVIYIDHHLSHAAGAYFSSPYQKAAVLTIDGVGEESTTTWGIGNKNKLDIKETICFPHSVGLLYSTFTSYLGFEVNEGEYKMMGLAPYGKPIYKNLILKELITLFDDGAFKINMKYFSFQFGRKMFHPRFEKLFEGKARKADENITQFHKDIAASIQEVTEEIIIKISNYIYQKTKQDSLCIAGGVGGNCVANYKLLKKSLFKNIHVQPSPGDGGSSVGVCYYIYHSILGNKKEGALAHVYLGSDYTKQLDENAFKKYTDKITYKLIENDQKLYTIVSKEILKNKVIGWYQGRTEFGPRALGNRSILGNPLSKENWQKINLKIKFRESFRPFAPSLTQEALEQYFDLKGEFPYMLFVSQLKDKKLFPAVTHVDGTARIQTVTKESNQRYYDLLKQFEKDSGYPILINTSFNLAGEPIVNTIEDAINTYLRCDMDYLVIGNYFINKKEC